MNRNNVKLRYCCFIQKISRKEKVGKNQNKQKIQALFFYSLDFYLFEAVLLLFNCHFFSTPAFKINERDGLTHT